MARALFFLSVLSIAILFFVFRPTPKEISKESSFLYSNPIISKAMLGHLSPFAADFAWLESTKIGELGRGGSYRVNKEEMYAAFLTISSLDPSFFHAINYGVSYLSTIAEDKKSAFEIIDRALLNYPDDFRLKYLKLIIEITDKNPDKALVRELAMGVFAHPEFKGVFGSLKMDDFLLDILAFSSNEGAKKEQLKKELIWLYNNTKDKNKKELISKKLKDIG